MADFYAARSRTIPPLPWPTFAPPLSRDAAPDLLPVLKVSWVEPNDEPLRVTRNGREENLTLTGMKVKMRNTADGLWMWVIVGADRKVMVFERDIHWITFPGKRGTEKWLHDTWLAEKGHSVGSVRNFVYGRA